MICQQKLFLIVSQVAVCGSFCEVYQNGFTIIYQIDMLIYTLLFHLETVAFLAN